MKYLPYFLILLVLLIAGGIYIDKTGKNKTLNNSEVATPLSAAAENLNSNVNTSLKNYGPAPELTGISNWINSEPLTLASLKGKVVLIDFWTYSCINCIRTLPYVTKWYDNYKDQGFVILGVHTPEFAFEKVTENVATAVSRFNIKYPVAQDNDFGTWNAYQNRYWPAHYLIDKDGVIRYVHFGEGQYEETENVIRYLLGLNASSQKQAEKQNKDVRSPEMYFGTLRLANLASSQKPMSENFEYNLPTEIKTNEFALSGNWRFSLENTTLTRGPGSIRLKFYSGKLYMVAKSQKEQDVKIKIDGILYKTVKIKNSELYTLFDSEDYKEHTVDIEIPEEGFEAFTFTFG